MTSSSGDVRPRGDGGTRGLAVRDAGALVFAADMYGIQLDQLARLTGGERSARAAAARWRELGYAETARLSRGAAWLWVTRAGLAACGLSYAPAQPALSRLAHIRAVAAARIALEATGRLPRGVCFLAVRAADQVQARGRCAPASAGRGGALARRGVRPGRGAVGWAGECWAVEAELTPKTVARTTSIMREILLRTGDYGCPAAEVAVPGRPPRHARALYLCSPPRCPPCCARERNSARCRPGSRSVISRPTRHCKARPSYSLLRNFSCCYPNIGAHP